MQHDDQLDPMVDANIVASCCDANPSQELPQSAQILNSPRRSAGCGEEGLGGAHREQYQRRRARVVGWSGCYAGHMRCNTGWSGVTYSHDLVLFGRHQWARYELLCGQVGQCAIFAGHRNLVPLSALIYGDVVPMRVSAMPT